MFKVPIDKIVPVTSARAKIASLVNDVQKSKSLYVLTRGGKPAAILASVEYLNNKFNNLPQTTPKEEKMPEVSSKKEKLPEIAPQQSTDITTEENNNDIIADIDQEQPVKISIK